MAVSSSANARRGAIVEALRTYGEVTVGDLARAHGVTDMTIRRDLAALDDEGLAMRVHGGARLPRPLAYESRTGVRAAEKAAIAERISAAIAPGETVGLDIGTTCRAVAERLARRNDLTVVTASLHAAMLFRHSGSRLIVPGGEMTAELTLINAGVIGALDSFRFDTVVLGCAGVSVAHGLTYYDPAEVAVRRALVDAAARVILAADHAKFVATAGFRLGPIGLASYIVTDDGLEASRRDEIAGHTVLDTVVVDRRRSAG